MIFVDFDGTISKQDICCAMVTQFAREGWQQINIQWEAGNLSTEECARLTLELMDVEPGQLDNFFEQMEIDESFIDFLRWAEQQGYPLAILSDGYDNYIEKILNRYGLIIPYYANHLEYRRGWQIKCLPRDKDCQQCGVCKTELMQDRMQPGYTSIYVGDGYSDLCPAENADVVFAKDSLARLCREKGIPFYEYANFHDIQIKLQQLVRQSPS